MNTTLSDINTEEDVRRMVDSFYERIRHDELLGPVFDVQAQVDWSAHLPKMYQFWNTLIFAIPQYKGAPFPPHIALQLSPKHFTRWLLLFHQTIDVLFEGPVAENTKRRAESIATIFDSKLRHIHGESYSSDPKSSLL